jgi:hypothetical protein
MQLAKTVWHGTDREAEQLLAAIARNCTCSFGLMGVRLSTCGPHRMLTDEQRTLDGLLFGHYIAERLIREECEESVW